MIEQTPVIRFDNLQFPKLTKTKEGYLKGKATVTRAGVLEYNDFTGKVRKELRDPVDVFDQDSLESITMIPITDGHPPVMLTAENSKQHKVGYTGERYEKLNNSVVVTMIITDKNTVKKVEDGLHQVSMGYTCILIPENGRFDGIEFTHKQKNIRYNHLSLVPKGRAGDDIRLRFDGACVAVIDIENNIKKDLNMSEETEQLKYDALESKFDASQKENELLKLKNEKTQAKYDHMEQYCQDLKKKLTAIEATRTDSMITDAARRTVKALTYGASALGDPMAYVEHSPRDIMITAINAKLATQRKDAIDFSSKSDEAVEESFNARFEVDSSSNNRLDCKGLITNLYNHYDSSHAVSLNQKIQAYEMSAKKKFN